MVPTNVIELFEVSLASSRGVGIWPAVYRHVIRVPVTATYPHTDL